MEKSLKGMSRVKNLNISKISMKVCVPVFRSNYAHSLLPYSPLYLGCSVLSVSSSSSGVRSWSSHFEETQGMD